MRFAYYLRNFDSRIQQRTLAGLRSAENISVFGKGEPLPDADVLLFYGIGGDTQTIFREALARGMRYVLLDKGYTRSGHMRVSVDSFQPTAYMGRYASRGDRWKQLEDAGYEAHKYVERGRYILLDGASNKYCLWNDLGSWQEWGQAQVSRIAQYTDRPILYRPRPSHNEAPIVEGAVLTEGALADDLNRSRVVVSHGGNIGFDSLLHGVGHFAIGNSVARPVSETDWAMIDQPLWPRDRKRREWLNSVAYCQWTADEVASGLGWRHIREVLDDRPT